MCAATWAVRACAASRTEFVIERPTHATIASAATTSAMPTTRTAVAVTRKRSRRRPSLIGRYPVAGTAHRLDRLAAERPVDLGAQVPDVDLHDVEVAVEVPVPHVVDDVGLRADGALAAQEVLQQREFASRQREFNVAPPRAPRRRIQPEVARQEQRRALGTSASDQRAEPRDERDVG